MVKSDTGQDRIGHVYVDKAANLEMAKKIVLDAKTDYPAACNTMETLLVHKDLLASGGLQELVKQLEQEDVALIMFSPSGRASIFSGSKSIEEIMSRYINLPEHERGRLQNQECLERALGKVKSETQDRKIQNQTSPASTDSQVEEVQQEIGRCKSRMIEMEKRLRIFEGDPSEITTLSETEYREQILEETLKRVRARKQILKKYNSADSQSSSQVSLPPDAITANNMVSTNQGNIFDWLPPRDPQVQIMNFVSFNGLVHQRQNEHVNRARVVESDNNANVQRTEFGQMIDMNLSPWAQFYPPGNGQMVVAQPGERPFSDSYIPQFSP